MEMPKRRISEALFFSIKRGKNENVRLRALVMGGCNGVFSAPCREGLIAALIGYRV
jgi:hypothetical protein